MVERLYLDGVFVDDSQFVGDRMFNGGGGHDLLEGGQGLVALWVKDGGSGRAVGCVVLFCWNGRGVGWKIEKMKVVMVWLEV